MVIKLNPKTRNIIITIVLLVLLGLIIVSYLGSSDRYIDKMGKLSIQYYEKNIKGKVFGLDRHIVTIETLEKNQYELGVLKKCDKKD